MQKTVAVDFWDVLGMDGDPFDLIPVIDAVSEATVAERMKPRWAGQIDFLAEASSYKSSTASGTAVLIRTEDRPGRVHLETGALNLLTLPTNEEVREDMSFHFDRDLRTLVTQRRQLFRASRLANLLRDITGAKFVIQPKLRADAWDRFKKLTRLGKVELKVQGPVHHPTFSHSTPSVAQLLDGARDETNAVEIGLSLSMGHVKSQSLTKQKIQTIVNYFRKDENARSLMVTGSEGDGDSQTVDFINDRLVFSGDVEYAEKHLDRGKCRQLLKQAVETNRDTWNLCCRADAAEAELCSPAREMAPLGILRFSIRRGVVSSSPVAA